MEYSGYDPDPKLRTSIARVLLNRFPSGLLRWVGLVTGQPGRIMGSRCGVVVFVVFGVNDSRTLLFRPISNTPSNSGLAAID